MRVHEVRAGLGSYDLDPVLEHSALAQRHNRLAYSAAYHAHAFLLEQGGTNAALRLLERLQTTDLSFDEAFTLEFGVEQAVLSQEFVASIHDQ